MTDDETDEMGEPITPDEWDEGDRQRAARKDDDAHDHFEQLRRTTAEFARTAERAAGVAAELGATAGPHPLGADPYELDDQGRHVLIIEPDGWTYIAPHQAAHPREECAAVQEALEVFLERVAVPQLDGPVLLPAFPTSENDDILSRRFWCSVGEDGNFEIGGRVA